MGLSAKPVWRNSFGDFAKGHTDKLSDRNLVPSQKHKSNIRARILSMPPFFCKYNTKRWKSNTDTVKEVTLPKNFTLETFKAQQEAREMETTN